MIFSQVHGPSEFQPWTVWGAIGSRLRTSVFISQHALCSLCLFKGQTPPSCVLHSTGPAPVTAAPGGRRGHRGLPGLHPITGRRTQLPGPDISASAISPTADLRSVIISPRQGSEITLFMYTVIPSGITAGPGNSLLSQLLVEALTKVFLAAELLKRKWILFSPEMFLLKKYF